MSIYEIGPIRPPSEARSLLIRVTRGCHWNKCKFCGLYKGDKFEMRPIADILTDIKTAGERYHAKQFDSCFLQDADAFVLKSDFLLKIVETIKIEFPSIKFITSYARPDSILRKSATEMSELRAAGLNHLYCGMETGSDNVLDMVNKGVTAKQIIESGIRAKEADMILSEFILFGLGGKAYSNESALMTAQALNMIKPDYIRVHAAAIKPETPLGVMLKNGAFQLLSEEEVIQEQKLLLEKLNKNHAWYLNEHAVNLLLEVRGNLKTDKDKMLMTINRYLNMSKEDKLIFALGRRLNIVTVLSDLEVSREKIAQYMSYFREQKNFDFDKFCNISRANMI